MVPESEVTVYLALPDNYSLSYSHLASLITRLRKTPVLREYDNGTRERESKGIIENVDADSSRKVHYASELASSDN